MVLWKAIPTQSVAVPHLKPVRIPRHGELPSPGTTAAKCPSYASYARFSKCKKHLDPQILEWTSAGEICPLRRRRPRKARQRAKGGTVMQNLDGQNPLGLACIGLIDLPPSRHSSVRGLRVSGSGTRDLEDPGMFDSRDTRPTLCP